MSLLDGQVNLLRDGGNPNNNRNRDRRDTRYNDNRNDRYNNGNRNYDNRNNRNNRNYNNNRNRTDNGSGLAAYMSGNANPSYDFRGSSYLPPQDEFEEVRNKDNNEFVNQKRDARADKLFDFCDDFTESISNYKQLQHLIMCDLPNVVKIMGSYYNTRTAPNLVDAMNKMVKVVSTTQFGTTLASTLDSGVWMDDGTYNNIWRDIAFMLSIALETNHERMHEDVIRKYVVDILPRMWNPEINEIVRQTGVTKDLALDLIIAIPLIGSELNGSNIDAFYPRFLDKMLLHADNNMDVLNHEVQGMLYDKFFGKSKNSLKIIGKYLTSQPRPKMNSEVPDAVYIEFIKMLYEKLDSHDINEISYVFKYVSKYRKENPDKKVIFNPVSAAKYENVKKGLLAVMDEDPDAMTTLA